MIEGAAISRSDALAWFADIFETSAEEISPETLKQDIDAWDSMGVLTLMAELDDRFSIILSRDELETINSIGDLLQILNNHHVLVG